MARELLPPQQPTAPPLVSAHVCSPPPAIPVAPVRPSPSTGVRIWGSVPGSHCHGIAPFPSWPTWLRPQHITPPLLVSAHVCCQPAAIAVTPPVRPTTSTGRLLAVIVPFPSCPYAL